MPFVMQTEPVSIKQIEPARGDLFAVITQERSLIVQADTPLPDADMARERFVPGVFGVEKDDPIKLWLRVYTHGTFTPCRYVSCMPECPACGDPMRVAGERFVCSACGQLV
jgi:tRNA(Ile2) C34 agmatinyltransferase TiaS